MNTTAKFNAWYTAIKEKATSGSTGNSDSLAAEITTQVLNTPDLTLPSYRDGKDGAYERTETKPVAAFREGLAGMAGKTLGLDRAETKKLADEMVFTDKVSRAFNDAAALSEAHYLDTGRSRVKPQLDPNVSRATIKLDTVPAKTDETKKIEKQADGSYASVPTGKKVTTAEHKALKVKNTTRSWLKKSEDVK